MDKSLNSFETLASEEREMTDAEIHAMAWRTRQTGVDNALMSVPENEQTSTSANIHGFTPGNIKMRAEENTQTTKLDNMDEQFRADDNDTNKLLENRESVVSHAEMRAMLWGRNTLSSASSVVHTNKQHVEQNNDKVIETRSGAKKACRPTSLSDEWNELCRLRESPSADSINSTNTKLGTRKSIWKNFISLCTGLMFAFMSFLPLRNILSSLYIENNLGCISLACIYSSFLVGSIVSPWMVQNARPKGLILISMFSHVLFVAANIFPSFYSLIPVSCIFGFFQAPLWSVQELLIASYGSSYSVITRMKLEKSIPQFQSVFVIFCHSAQIFGNLIESAVLTLAKDNPIEQYILSNNSANSTPAIYNASVSLVHTGFEIQFGQKLVPKNDAIRMNSQVNLLKFIYLGIACLSMTTIGFCLRKPDIILNKRKTPLKDKLYDVVGFFTSKTFLMLGLLMVFTGMQQAVVITDVTKIYGTDTLGLAMVGYLMMSYGTCQLATLLVLEKLQKRFKPIVFVLKGFLITLGLLVLLYIWEPKNNSIYTIFGFMSLWGVIDAVWQSQVQNILVTTCTRKEPAVIGFRICQGVGLTAVFLMSIFMPLLYKVCAIGAILVFGVMGYMMMEVTNNPVTPADAIPYSL